MKTRGSVFAKELSKRGLGLSGKEVESEIGGADVVRLLGEEGAMSVEAGDSAREGEREQEAKETEDGAFDGAISFGMRTAVAETTAGFKEEEHRRKQEKSDHG